jgi:repressor LexA
MKRDSVHLYGMIALTKRQQQIVDFVNRSQRVDGRTPTYRDIADRFRLCVGTVVGHVKALRRKGFLAGKEGRACSLRVISPLQALRSPVLDIPVYGSIPAGFAEDRQQEAKGCVSVDIETLGLKPTSRTFALEVRGDSMIGQCIMDGDLVVLEHGMTPRNGDVVAALIDNESTLKTFVLERGKPYLRAENPRYPKMIPASELVIQGVMVALIRKRQ